MIINGGSRSGAAFFAKHLTNAEHNERVTIIEFRNLAATTIADAFREMHAVALGTRCELYFYHANLNPRADETLSESQWLHAVDTLERHLSLINHARFVVEHHKVGRTHRHVIWSRINAATMTAVKMTDDYAKHQLVARLLEKDFGLAGTLSVKDRGAADKRPPRRPKTWESFRGQLSGVDPWKMTKTVTAIYRGSHTGSEFAAALARTGCTLVRGDRVHFCIRDEAGHLHSLARRIEGVSASELSAFMKDIDPASLAAPSTKV